jgi:uncharacterized protein YgbK (DUF1537 family)
VSAAQGAVAARLHHVLPPTRPAAVARTPGGDPASVALSLSNGGAAVATAAVPSGASRELALAVITAAFSDLLQTIQRPGTLVVSGGETLRAVGGALAADRLDLDGKIEPGVPTSILRGGPFDGLRVVSKSAAFGSPDFVTRMLAS